MVSSLSFDGIWPDRPEVAGTASPVHAKNSPKRPVGNAINHDSKSRKQLFCRDSEGCGGCVPEWNRTAADSEAVVNELWRG
jgi:hypothetical protein